MIELKNGVTSLGHLSTRASRAYQTTIRRRLTTHRGRKYLKTTFPQLLIVSLRVFDDVRCELTQGRRNLVRRVARDRSNKLDYGTLLLNVPTGGQARDDVGAQERGKELRLGVGQELRQGRDCPFPHGRARVVQNRR